MNKMQLFSESRLFLELSEDSLFLAVSFIKDLHMVQPLEMYYLL